MHMHVRAVDTTWIDGSIPVPDCARSRGIRTIDPAISWIGALYLLPLPAAYYAWRTAAQGVRSVQVPPARASCFCMRACVGVWNRQPRIHHHQTCMHAQHCHRTFPSYSPPENKLLLTPFQIIRYFGFSKYIAFSTYLDIVYIYVHSKSYVFRKAS